jgi:hypothetical protein
MPAGNRFSSSRLSAAKGFSVPSRAPCSHQTSRADFAAANECSIDNTGVIPTPADNRTSGRLSSARKNVPRGAATSIRSSAFTCAWMYPLPRPWGSFFTLIRYSSEPGRFDSE